MRPPPGGNPGQMLVRRIARPMLAAAFVGRGIDTLRNPADATEAARPALEGLQKLPEPVGSSVPRSAATFAKATAAVQIASGLLLATGRLPRLASATLAATVIPSSLGSEMFWAEDDPVRKAAKRRDLLTDVSLLGGLVIASADTAGKPSLGWRGRRAAARLGDTVAAALPAGGESDVADRVGQRLQSGLETGFARGREFAEAAAERGAPVLEAARERSADYAHAAAERGGPLLEAARQRGVEFAHAAREEGEELAGEARKQVRRRWRH